MKKYKLTLTDIALVHKAYCRAVCKGNCTSCPVFMEKVKTDLSCGEFVERYPDKAAELMELEVVEDGPRLTEQELAICKALKAKWVSRHKFHIPEIRGGIVNLWKCKPHYNGAQYTGTGLLAQIDIALFPSLNPGDLVNVEEQLKEVAK